MAFAGMFLGLGVTLVEVGVDPLWVNFTIFQLSVSTTYLLASTVHERVFDPAQDRSC
jgi:hypothetical protein